MERSLLASASQSTVGEELRDDAASAAVGEYEAAVPVVEPARRGPSAVTNALYEVGNCGLFLGNWGERGTVQNSEYKMKRRQAHDRQIMKGPAQIIVLLEANAAVADLLRQAPVQGVPHSGLEQRPTFQYFVERGPEDGKSILIAAREDTCSKLEVLKYDCHDDHRYTFKRQERMARTRIMVARITFKQNIGHIGKEVLVAGVHASQMTMEIKWKEVWGSFWDRLANFIRSHGIQFVAGDFNMSLTEVPKQLGSRGLSCDCVAWFPCLSWPRHQPPEVSRSRGRHN